MLHKPCIRSPSQSQAAAFKQSAFVEMLRTTQNVSGESHHNIVTSYT